MQVDRRKEELVDWLQKVLKTTNFSCEPASSDASFRRYFRIVVAGKSYVVMDAPPEKEDCTNFISIATLLNRYGVHAPELFHYSEKQGFLVLSDLGTQCYLDVLGEQTADLLYAQAVDSLHKMQQIPCSEANLPAYDEALLTQEIELFSEWFLVRLLGIKLSPAEENLMSGIHTELVCSAIQQPRVFVHRDFHSRNLMFTQQANPGIIDFQDAVLGPLTYDLVSLFRDCYIAWPDHKIHEWLNNFLNSREEQGIDDNFEPEQFYQWFDWMGVQRHMKAIGIFSRLLLRDGKPGYLNDIPRTMLYIEDVCRRYSQLEPMVELLSRHDVTQKINRLLKKSAV